MRSRELLSGIPFCIAALAHAYVRAGESEEATQLLAQLEALHPTCYVDPYNFAVVYAGLGDIERAFESLETSYREGSLWLSCWVRCDPRLEPLHGDARFGRLLRRVGVAD